MTQASLPSETSGTRERLIHAMTDALRRRGLHGMGLNELLVRARAPKGVLYHHFPGGKQALALAAIDQVGEQMLSDLDALLRRLPDPVDALRRWLGAAVRQLQASGFEAGCPLATVALESGPGDADLRAAINARFQTFRGRLALALVDAGRSAPEAEGLAALIVATYEGGLLQARVAQDPAPMEAALQALIGLLNSPDAAPNSPAKASR